MSLVGFKAGNHPQQTDKRGARDNVDDRGTTAEVFGPLNERFGFTLDVAAAPHNAKCRRYFTRHEDGLEQPWGISRVWCNPPYSDCGAWVRKAWSEWLLWPHVDLDSAEPSYLRRNPSPSLIVMLLPANRTEQAWWQDLVEPHRDRPGSPLRVEFLRGRMRFDRPGIEIGPKGDRPPFGVCLLIWEAKP